MQIYDFFPETASVCELYYKKKGFFHILFKLREQNVATKPM